MAEGAGAAQLTYLGIMDYGQVHSLQLELVARRISGVLHDDLFLVTEHPRVYTLGRRGGREHLMVSDAFLEDEGIQVVPIERGGVITYHGPGQLVIYPIIDLRKASLSVKRYVHLLEAVMLELAGFFAVTANRDERNYGVWVGPRKLGSIGIAIRHGVAFHGLAINVNTDLTPFTWVHPCGLTGVQMTSLSREANREITVGEVITILNRVLQKVFARQFCETPFAGSLMEDILYGPAK